MVKGMHIPFVEKLPKQNKIPHQIPLNAEESHAVSLEVETLVKKGVIVPTTWTGNDFFSTVFTRPKPNGYRMILNLKHLNDYVEYQHFKMQNANTAIQLMRPFCWMGSLDLTDAYYSCYIAPSHQEYLKFQWNGKMWKFQAMPNGVSVGPRRFTKLLKPVYAQLAGWGYVFVGYIDDSWTMDCDYDICYQGIMAGKQLFENLGFLISESKSIFIPVQIIEFLGLILDSIRMQVRLTQKKTDKILALLQKYINWKFMTIRELCKIIGNIIAALPAAQYGKMHYRHLERFKIKALKQNQGNFDAYCRLTALEKTEMQWWIDNISDVYNPIQLSPVETFLHTDSSGYAWGAVHDLQQVQNWFSEEEFEFSINTKELLAIKYALRCFREELAGKHVHIKSDNTTAISYVKNMGGTKHGLRNQIALDIWEFAIEHSIWITITHIPGIENVMADEASRVLYNPRTEWALKQEVFDLIVDQMGPVDIDMFASMLNNKLPRYVSWQRDPYSEQVDAFTMDWNNLNMFLFPPFSMINKVVQKLLQTKCIGNVIIVVPKWPTQPWYPILQRNAQKTMDLPKKCVSNPVLKAKSQPGDITIKNTHFQAVKF